MSKAFPVKMAIYTLVVGYLCLDLFVLKGPVHGWVERRVPGGAAQVAEAERQGVVARVFGEPVYLAQVDRALEEKLWREGQEMSGLSANELLFWRKEVLRDLIDEHLLRIKVRHNHRGTPVGEEEIEAAVERFAKRFGTREEMLEAIRGQGWEGEKELRYRLAARLQREKYLGKIIRVEVGEEEARAWYEANKARLALPERRRARQVFLAVTDYKEAEGEKLAREVFQAVKAGRATFAEAVRKFSGDPASKPRGGDLGWMRRERLPEDFAEPLFNLPSGRLALVRTRLGWHILEVTGVRPPRERGFEECKAEVMTALEALKREEGLFRYRYQLRGQHRTKVRVFEKVLEKGLLR